MTEKKSLLVKHGMLADLMLGLIVYLTVQSAEMFVMYGYITALDLGFRFLVVPVVFTIGFLILRRLRLKQLWMIGAHLLFIAASCAVIFVLAGANTYEKLAVILSAIFQAIYSLKQRYKIEDFVVKSDLLYLGLTVNLISFIIISYHRKADFLSLILINTILVVTFFFVARQSNVLDVAYYHSLRSETQNVNSVKRQNRMSMIIIVLGIAVSLLLLYTFPTNKVTHILSAMIVAVLKFLFGHLNTGEDVKPDAPDDMDLNMPFAPDQGGDPIVLKIIVLLVFLVIVAGFFASLVVAIRAFLARYNVADDKPTADSDGAVIDLIENVKKCKNGKKVAMDFGKGYEKEIRKKFYHKVKKGMKAGLPIGKTSSPRQIEKVLAANGDTSISELTDSYEKVRYSKEELT